ncbi:histidine phosphatase superfamily [Coprinopsis sp. MPI-PUGE-AT-0042]|nr:histidine phosphatase superfamily [Coprinopsis sp. MPI-PUGE-AT-0042]
MLATTSLQLAFFSSLLGTTSSQLQAVDCARVPSPLCNGKPFSWCNMPHVTSETYKVPPKEYILEYVEVIQRHHKRTPYSSNIFPTEDIPWNCEDESLLLGLSVPSVQGQTAVIERTELIDATNPFSILTRRGFVNSSCQFPQLTKGGFEDALAHGADLRSVYGSRLQLSDHYVPSEASFRITNNVITSQVASGFFKGFYPMQDFSNPIPASIQPSSIDSLEPTYSCPRANSLRTSFTTGSNGSVWKDHLQQGQGLWSTLDSISGVSPSDGGWHANFDHYFDNLSAKLCHYKPLPCNLSNRESCITQDLADRVFEQGHWEYGYLFRSAPGAFEYASLKFGAWMLELQSRLKARISGSNKIKYAHNIAHDGSISNLLGFLQLEGMAWPGMGSEVSFELYRANPPSKEQGWFLRVLWSGQPLKSASLGTLDMIPAQKLFDYIQTYVGTGDDLYRNCA